MEHYTNLHALVPMVVPQVPPIGGHSLETLVALVAETFIWKAKPEFIFQADLHL